MLTCIRSKRQRNVAEYALRAIQSSCISLPARAKKYLYLLKSEVSSVELDDAETDLKIVVGDDWKRNKMLYYTNVRKEGIQIWP